MSHDLPTHFECIEPILCVEDLSLSLRCYVHVLGFEQADWRTTRSPPFPETVAGSTCVRASKGHRAHGSGSELAT